MPAKQLLYLDQRNDALIAGLSFRTTFVLVFVCAILVRSYFFVFCLLEFHECLVCSRRLLVYEINIGRLSDLKPVYETSTAEGVPVFGTLRGFKVLPTQSPRQVDVLGDYV